MSKATEIFKLQRAVFGDDLCLVYNKNRSIMGQFPTTEAELTILGEELKVFYWGHYNEKTGKVEFIRHCTQQELKGIYW